MRTILAACVALSALAMPAMAQVTITTGPAYWRGHDDWRAREAFKEDQYQKQAWVEDHCVRDWSGHPFCRR